MTHNVKIPCYSIVLYFVLTSLLLLAYSLPIKKEKPTALDSINDVNDDIIILDNDANTTKLNLTFTNNDATHDNTESNLDEMFSGLSKKIMRLRSKRDQPIEDCVEKIQVDYKWRRSPKTIVRHICKNITLCETKTFKKAALLYIGRDLKSGKDVYKIIYITWDRCYYKYWLAPAG